MGARYEIIWLAGVCYIEYANRNTDYNTIAIELTHEQVREIEHFYDKQAEEKDNFLENFIEKMKQKNNPHKCA